MKERWKYSDYVDEETEKPVYYRLKQRLTWQFYIRIIKKWFTPCDKCQENMDLFWNCGVVLNTGWYEITAYINKLIKTRTLCINCQKAMQRIMVKSEVILGNKDYDPPIELQRRWVDVMKKNENGVLDLISVIVTKKEYYKVKGWKLPKP